MVKKFFYLLITILFLGQNNPSQATEPAKAFIKDLGSRAITSLTQPGVSQSQLQSNFQSLLEEGFDVQAIGHFVMGRYWNMMTPDQQARFIPLFEARLVKSYANRFQQYQGVVFTVKEAHQERGGVVVNSVIDKAGTITPVDWKVQDGKIHDVKVEGVSMSITIRDEYSSLVQSNNRDIEKFLNALGDSSGNSSN